MDKKEYNLKLEEIDKYVNQGNYSEAAKVADEIDWRRVRNVRTLCMISEIYEADNRYEDSKELLMRAYRHSPVGRSILYRLVEVTIHLKQFDEAIEYYSEYVQAAPHDNSRYILKYKIYRGRGSSLEEQIDILKEYLDQEYNEKWAYELAKLYQQAGKIQECLATCDDLVLWFHSGKYVIKALELKRKYAALTPKQQEIYDRRFDEIEDDDVYADEAEIGKEKQIVETNEDELAETIMADTEKEIAKAVAETAKEADETVEEQTEPDEAAEAEVVEPEDEDIQEPEDVKVQKPVEENPDEPVEEEFQDTVEEDDAEDTTQASGQDQSESAPERDLQSDLVKSMREIVSGVNRRPEPDPDEELANQVIEQSKEEQETAREKEISLQIPKMQISEQEGKNKAAQLSIDDILLSMGEKGDAIRQAAAKASREMQSGNRPAGVVSAMDEALMNMGVDLNAVQKEESHPAPPAEEEMVSPRQEEARKSPAQEELKAEKPKAEKPIAEKPAEEETAPRTEEEIISAKTRRIPTDEIAEIHAFSGLDAEADAAEFLKEETRANAPETPENTEAKNLAPDTQAPGNDVQEAPAPRRRVRKEAGKVPEQTRVQERPRHRVYSGPMLKEYQKSLFPGFLDIQNLEAQIASAIALAEQKGDDRTSRTGNILIFGDHGCGKTTIAVGIAKAIAQDKGNQFVKMAKIYAADLNRKDIAATIAKIAGGVLIVEEAGDLEDAVVDQMTTAMEFRTDGLIIILEDEQRYIHDLLMRHPRFTMKFTSQIFIPTFTIDELVRFGEIYAGNHDYVFSEGAAAALYDRISSVSAQGDVVSITNVLELVDRAIRKANKFFRKMGSGKKRYDENDCVILQEKDFK